MLVAHLKTMKEVGGTEVNNNVAWLFSQFKLQSVDYDYLKLIVDIGAIEIKKVFAEYAIPIEIKKNNKEMIKYFISKNNECANILIDYKNNISLLDYKDKKDEEMVKFIKRHGGYSERARIENSLHEDRHH